MQKFGEWGKYFPKKLSAFGYNESFAYDMDPLSKDEPFKLIKQEVEFYKKQGIPFPKKHPDVRIEQRYRIRNPNRFFERKCMKCGEDIVTTYDPRRLEIVYCEKCYIGE